MAIFNIVCAKKGREEYFNAFILHIAIATAEAKNIHKVNIYAVYGDRVWRNYHSMPGVNIISLPFYQAAGVFNKSILLNYGLKYAASEECDYIGIMDIDLCYEEIFFNVADDEIRSNEILICGGEKLGKEISRKILDGQEAPKPASDKTNYPSQITMKPKTYRLLLAVLGRDKLYNERFVGWGGEDSAVSALIRALDKRGLVRRIYKNGMWVHLWHEGGYRSPVLIEQNKELFQKLEIEYQKKAREYKSGD